MTDEALKPPNNNVDLSQDSLLHGNVALRDKVLDPQESLSDNSLGLQEFKHRTELEKLAFGWSIGAVFLLYGVALILASIIVGHYAVTNSAPDWHISALVGAIIIPPTVILVVLIGAAYHTKNGIELPTIKYIKTLIETLKAVKDVF
ncbi:MAG: hypothetical protein LBH10_02795 [Burkholderiaceae bacterium]|jgi:hypothetical protein|nr:hypothetical protein [Burkholderiaceae bacterium]